MLGREASQQMMPHSPFPSSPLAFSPSPTIPLPLSEVVCHLLHHQDLSVAFASMAIEKLLLNPNVDLMNLSEPTAESGLAAQQLYCQLRQLLGGESAVFVMACQDPSVAAALFSSIRKHADASRPCAARSCSSSVLGRCILEWASLLLPLQSVCSGSNAPSPSSSLLHTPLELFVPDCPLVLSVPPPAEADGVSLAAGAYLASQLISALCDSHHFPSVNRLLLLRTLIKQLHAFCLYDGGDLHVSPFKKALMLRPPFDSALYNFLLMSMEQCHSIHIFRKIFMLKKCLPLDLILGVTNDRTANTKDVWLSFVRPWRYVLCDPARYSGDSLLSSPDLTASADISRFFHFVDAHSKFYTVLYGKILRRLSELELSPDCLDVVRIAVELSYIRPGLADAFEHLGVDPQPAVKKMLDLFAEYCDSPSPAASSAFSSSVVNGARSTGESFLNGSAFIFEDIRSPLRNLLGDVASVLQYQLPERPARPASPNHHKLEPSYVVSPNGFKVLTPLGRQQVRSGERSFDFSPAAAATHSSRITSMLKRLGFNEWVHSPSKPAEPIPPFRRLFQPLPLALQPEVKRAAIIISSLVVFSLFYNPAFLLLFIYVAYIYMNGVVPRD